MQYAIVQDADERLLEELLASKKLVKTSRGPLWLHLPLGDDILYAKFLFNDTLETLKAEGTPTVDEAFAEHKKLGLWTDADEEALTKIPEFIAETTEKIVHEINRIRKKKYEKWLVSLNRKMGELYSAKMQLFSSTAEILASRASNAYMVYSCFKPINGAALWGSFEEMMGSWEDAAYVEELSEILNTDVTTYEQTLMRKVARGNAWRIRWNVGKTDITTLFGRSMADLGDNQLMLIYWSQVYDSVYESLDRPPDSVIEDDAELDEWFTEQSEKRKREVGQRYHGKSKTTKNSKIDNSPEVFKVVSGYYNNDGEYVLYSDTERWNKIEHLRELNAPETRAVQRQGEEEMVKTPGQFTPEQRLRKSERAIEATGGTVEVKGKRSR